MCFGVLVTNDKLIQLVNPLLNEWLSMVKLKILSIRYQNAHSVCIRLAPPGYSFKRIIKNTKFVSSFVVFLLLRKCANFLTTYFRCVSFWDLYKIWIFQARTQDLCKRNIFWSCFLSFACNFTYKLINFFFQFNFCTISYKHLVLIHLLQLQVLCKFRLINDKNARFLILLLKVVYSTFINNWNKVQCLNSFRIGIVLSVQCMPIYSKLKWGAYLTVQWWCYICWLVCRESVDCSNFEAFRRYSWSLMEYFKKIIGR